MEFKGMRSLNIEVRSTKQIQMPKQRCFVFGKLEFRICLGFRVSCLGFA